MVRCIVNIVLDKSVEKCCLVQLFWYDKMIYIIEIFHVEMMSVINSAMLMLKNRKHAILLAVIVE